MTRVQPAAGGGRWVHVAPARLEGWLADFTARHGQTSCLPSPRAVVVTADDGAVAECLVPLVPLTVVDAPFGGLLEHAQADRRVGVLLVRLGGHAAGVFVGDRLESSKVGSRQVHGRNAAGGQSQQRFARRRDGQVRAALGAAADNAAVQLLPALPGLEAVVVGGDRRALDLVLADPRLTALRPILVDTVLEVPDPRLAVLRSTPPLFRAVRIRLLDQER